MVDFTVPDELRRCRLDASAWADANFDPDWAIAELSTGTYHTDPLHRRLAADGILGAGWPPEYGGSGVDPGFATAVLSELAERGGHQEGWVTTEMVLRTVLQVGSERQKREWIPAGLRGEMIIVLGYTEPESGSDAAAAALRAVRDGTGGWTLTGSKMFTSTAQSATHVFLLTRTSTKARKHQGLTMFMVPLDAHGVDIQPIYTLGGQRTNATFYNEVRVPDEARVGEVDGGWRVMRVALVHERSALNGTAGPTLAQRTAEWAMRTPAGDGGSVWDDAVVREKVARIAIDEEVSRLLALDVMAASAAGVMSGVEGAMRKLFEPEAAQRNLSVVLDLIGAQAQVRVVPGRAGEDQAEAFPGEIERAFRGAVVDTIYGGSSEIMREIIAERHLGLPKNRPAL
jgi:alkylation response protein AidB-like acyl-CoA dehydrogenase